MQAFVNIFVELQKGHKTFTFWICWLLEKKNISTCKAVFLYWYHSINPFLFNLRLVGGNAVGIFIHSVDPDSAAYHASLRGADQILEYNGIDLRQATAEQAAYELP